MRVMHVECGNSCGTAVGCCAFPTTTNAPPELLRAFLKLSHSQATAARMMCLLLLVMCHACRPEQNYMHTPGGEHGGERGNGRVELVLIRLLLLLLAAPVAVLVLLVRHGVARDSMVDSSTCGAVELAWTILWSSMAAVLGMAIPSTLHMLGEKQRAACMRSNSRVQVQSLQQVPCHAGSNTGLPQLLVRGCRGACKANLGSRCRGCHAGHDG